MYLRPHAAFFGHVERVYEETAFLVNEAFVANCC